MHTYTHLSTGPGARGCRNGSASGAWVRTASGADSKRFWKKRHIRHPYTVFLHRYFYYVTMYILFIFGCFN